MEEKTETRVLNASELRERVGSLPQKPGVYIMRDSRDEIIYVGKAVNLRARVRSYFTKSGDSRYFVQLLDKVLSRIDFIITSNEREALLLEANLIKKHRPRYNIRLRDDKNYLLVRLDEKKPFPRLDVVRRFKDDGARYFGPYQSAYSARAATRFASRYFGLRICSDRNMKGRTRPCIQYHMGRCPAPCVLEVDPEEYAKRVGQVKLFLAGRHSTLSRELRSMMENASENLEFERAAKYRDVIRALDSVMEPQNVVFVRPIDQDVFGLARDNNRIEICVLEVRAGRLIGRRSFLLKRQEFPDGEVLSSFLVLYYMGGRLPPREILLPVELDDEEALAAELSELKKSKVGLKRPRRGTKRRLVEMAVNNAGESLLRRLEGPDKIDLVERLARRLRLCKVPHRMECFDVSHTSGGEIRASMAVFVKGEPKKSEYRVFKISKTGDDQVCDDYSSMKQALERRVRRALAGSEGWELPDLMIVDGGRGQLGVAEKVLREAGIEFGGIEFGDKVFGDEKAGSKESGYEVVDEELEGREVEQGMDAGGVEAEGVEAEKIYVEKDHVDLLAIAKGEIPRKKELRDFLAAKAEAEGEEYKVFRESDHLYLPRVKDPLPVKGAELLLLAHIRDEAHGFAVRSHRKARNKKAFKGELDDIRGVGKARRKALMQHFGSLKKIKEANQAELREAGMPENIAKEIKNFFKEKMGTEEEK